MSKFNFSYDKENDDLFLFSPISKSKGSVELGELILDFNGKKELVGIQMMNASKFINDLVEQKDSSGIKQLLESLQECKVEIKVKNNLLIVKVYLISKTMEISPVLSLPSITETSPALAYA